MITIHLEVEGSLLKKKIPYKIKKIPLYVYFLHIYENPVREKRNKAV